LHKRKRDSQHYKIKAKDDEGPPYRLLMHSNIDAGNGLIMKD